MENMNEDCDIQVLAHIDGLVSLKLDIHGANYGLIFIYIFNLITFKDR